LIERAELVSGETCVTVCVAVRGIQREKIMKRQREEFDRGGRSVRRGEYYERNGVAISKIDNRIKVFKFCLLNVCKSEYGI
jgi:hypothetical protein